jgi:hypothetical protein
MSMTKLQIGIAAAVLAAGAAGFMWQQRANDQLRTQLAELRQQDGELARLRGENARLAAAVAAASTPAPAAPAAAPAAARTPPPQSQASDGRGENSVPLAPGLVAVTSLGNAGRATPRAAFATQLWAARSGDVALEAAVLALEPAARARLEEALAALPEDFRAQYGTPEQLLAFALSGSPHPVGGMRVAGETAQDADNVILHTEWQHADDDIVHQSDVHFRRDADGWRWVVPLPLVNRAAAYLTRTGGAKPGAGGN